MKKTVNRYTREEALKLVRENGYNLRLLGKEFQKDREIVLEAVRNNGNAYKRVKALKNDIEVIEETIKNCRSILFSKFFPNWIFKNKEIMLLAVTHNSHSTKLFDKDLFEDIDFIAECLKVSPESIKWLPNTVKYPEAMYLSVVNVRSDLMGYVPEYLMLDENFIIKCIKGSYKNIVEIPPKYYTLKALKVAIIETPSMINVHSQFAKTNRRNTQKDVAEIIECIKLNSQCYKYLPDVYKNNHQIINAAVDCDGNIVLHVKESLCNVELLCRAVRSTPTVLKRLNKKLYSYKLILTAVSVNAHTIKYAPEYAKHAEIFDAMIKNDVSAIMHLDNANVLMHANLIYQLCLIDGVFSCSLAHDVYVPEVLKNVALVEKLAEKNLYILTLCSDAVLENSNLRKKMVKLNPLADLLFDKKIN